MTTPIAPLDLRESRRRARRAAAAALRRRLRLPPRLTLSEWADRYRRLSAESSAEPGPWQTDRVPYLRAIMDAISGREYQDITIVKSSQTAGTEALNNAVGYFMDQEPSPILMIQPNVKPMAEAWSKDRLAPMVRDSPRLARKVKDPRSRDSGNTVLHKVFPGGYITVIGANSPAGLASRPIRVVLADELDRWPASAGTEGDPLSLAEARTFTFRHRKKLVKVSTPGNAGESRIEKEWAASDQRHFYVPCPHCAPPWDDPDSPAGTTRVATTPPPPGWQPLEWRDSGDRPDIRAGRGEYRLVWEKDEERNHRPETAAYQCDNPACTKLIPESAKPAMLAAGRWVKHAPGSDRAGFFISGLLSPWVRWRDIAARWLKVKDDPEQRKTFFNTMLGLLYVQDGEQPDAEKLISRCEELPTDGSGAPVVPMAVGAITLSVDVQDDRLEVELRGWAEGEESYLLRVERLYGDPDEATVWAELESLRTRPWRHESGATMRVAATMVDSGYLTDAVYRYVRPRQGQRVFAYKGVENAKQPISRASRANKDGVKVFNVNPVKFKDILFARLRRQRPGPGYLHFGLPEQTGAHEDFFHQYGAEQRVVEFVRNVPVVRYVRLAHRRNEAIDLYVMNLAALRALGMHFTQSLGKKAAALARRAAAGVTEAPESDSADAAASSGTDASPPNDEEPPPSPEPRRPTGSNPYAPRRGGGWVNRWRR